MSESLFLKDVTETRTATGYGGLVAQEPSDPPPVPIGKGRPAWKVQHLQAKFNAIRRLGIPTEPFVAATVIDGTGYIVTRKVGRSLEELRRQEPAAFAQRAPYFAEGIARFIGILHGHNFIHRHPHLGNFTYDTRLPLIDIGRVKRLRTLDWSNADEAGRFFPWKCSQKHRGHSRSSFKEDGEKRAMRRGTRNEY